jgi:hypothetical protein
MKRVKLYVTSDLGKEIGWTDQEEIMEYVFTFKEGATDFSSLKSWKLESAKKITTYVDPKLIIDGSKMWETLFASAI